MKGVMFDAEESALCPARGELAITVTGPEVCDLV